MANKTAIVKGKVKLNIAEKTYTCLECSKLSQERGQDPKSRSYSGGFSNVLRHFDSAHPQVFENIMAPKKQVKKPLIADHLIRKQKVRLITHCHDQMAAPLINPFALHPHINC